MNKYKLLIHLNELNKWNNLVSNVINFKKRIS